MKVAILGQPVKVAILGMHNLRRDREVDRDLSEFLYQGGFVGTELEQKRSWY